MTQPRYTFNEETGLEPPHIHDAYCRCRRCKPPLVGSYAHNITRRIEIAVLVIAGVFCALAWKVFA